MLYAILLVVMLITPYAIIKAYELAQRKKNKDWSNEEAEPIDNWRFPSNF